MSTIREEELNMANGGTLTTFEGDLEHALL